MTYQTKLSEPELLALSLMYGAPNPLWTTWAVFYADDSPEAERLRKTIWLLVQPSEFGGVSTIAVQFTHWYLEQEKRNGPSESGLHA